MKKSLIVALCLALVLSFTGCQSVESSQTTNITISCAASLTAPMEALIHTFNAEHEDTKLSGNYASSGALQKQILEGAPVDLFFSASAKKMEPIVDAGLVLDSNNKLVLSNELILVSSTHLELKSDDEIIKDLKNASKIAVGEPASAPVGRYAKEALEALNLYEVLQPQMVFGKNVSAVVDYVDTGNVDYGILYASDITRLEQAKELYRFDSSLHSPIAYPLAVINTTESKDAAQTVFDYLTSEDAMTTYQQYGFEPFGENK